MQMTLRRRAIGTSLAITMVAVAACGGHTTKTGDNKGSSVTNVGTTNFTTGTATKDVSAVTWYGDYRPLYSMDPLKTADYPEETIIPNVCEPVVRVAPDYQISPGLVSWKYSSPTTLVLTVRNGVTFSDGTPLRAEDVAYSLNRNLDPKVASNYGYAFSTVKSITATGTDTVDITFTQPSPLFINTLGTLAGAVVEKAFAEKAGQAFGSPNTGVVCTGPFTFVSYDGSSKLVLKRNDRYWDTAHRAKAGTFTFVFPTDPTALANGFKSGRIDGGYNVPSNVIKDLKSAPNGKVYLGGEGSTPVNIDLLMSKTTGIGADPRVRQALSMVLDRKAIASSIFVNTADPLYAVSGPGLWGYARDTYAEAYKSYQTQPDVAAAKKLIDAAGASGQSLNFAYPSGDPQSVQLATAVQQEAAQIGLKINLTGLPNQQYGSLFIDATARKPFDLFITKNYVELPEPLTMDMLYGTKNGATNFSGYDNQTVASNLGQAAQTADPQARAKLVIAAEAQLAKDLPSIPIVTPRSVVFENSRLTGASLTFSYMTSPWAAAVGAP